MTKQENVLAPFTQAVLVDISSLNICSNPSYFSENEWESMLLTRELVCPVLWCCNQPVQVFCKRRDLRDLVVAAYGIRQEMHRDVEAVAS